MLFDAYLIVDWSAHSRPKRGKDSIWIAYHEGAVVHPPQNFRTRVTAKEFVRETLVDACRRSLRVLVGFDFPYGYPRGFAHALDLPGESWQAIWNVLSQSIVDGDRNQNNRWSVAAHLNEQIGHGPGPFWNVPAAYAGPWLLATRPIFPFHQLTEYRRTEQRLRDAGRNVQSAWKLFTAGSVGSQALLGIPVVASLRHDPELALVSQVWPFETGAVPPSPSRCGPTIWHAEIWPSLFPVVRQPDEVLDAAQVRCLAERFAHEDANNELAQRFVVDDDPDRVSEEGWILGV